MGRWGMHRGVRENEKGNAEHAGSSTEWRGRAIAAQRELETNENQVYFKADFSFLHPNGRKWEGVRKGNKSKGK